jgi:hypothetical protein
VVLQVDALGGRIGREEETHGRDIRPGLEGGLDALTLLAVHATVEEQQPVTAREAVDGEELRQGDVARVAAVDKVALAGAGRLLVRVVAAAPPGSFLPAALAGRPAAAAALLAVAAAGIAVAALAGGDCYPELWRASLPQFTVRRARRERRSLTEDERRDLRAATLPGVLGGRGTARAGRSRVPPGAWTVLWLEWLTTRRRGAWRIALVLGGALAVGVWAGLAGRSDPGLLAAILGPACYFVLVGNAAATVRLAATIGKPLWWLSAAPLRARLAAWTLAGTLRQAVPIVAGVLVAAALAGQPTLAAAGVAAGLALPWLSRAMALLTYTLLPSTIDLRGPGALLRLLANLVLLLPVAAVALPAGLLTGALLPAVLAGAAAAAAEGFALLLAAAARIAGNGVDLARAERR